METLFIIWSNKFNGIGFSISSVMVNYSGNWIVDWKESILMNMRKGSRKKVKSLLNSSFYEFFYYFIVRREISFFFVNFIQCTLWFVTGALLVFFFSFVLTFFRGFSSFTSSLLIGGRLSINNLLMGSLFFSSYCRTTGSIWVTELDATIVCSFTKSLTSASKSLYLSKTSFSNCSNLAWNFSNSIGLNVPPSDSNFHWF